MLGCLFHFDQCIHRKVQNIGLQQLFRDDDATKRWIRRILALPLAPLASFATGPNGSAVWNAVLEAVPADADIEKVNQLHRYIQNPWLDMENAQFAPFLWNHFVTGNVRTINAVEGWHRIVNTFFKKPHPNIYKFIDIIKNQQRKTSLRVAQLQGGAPNLLQRKTYSAIDNAIQVLKEHLQNGVIDLPRYLDSVGYNLRF